MSQRRTVSLSLGALYIGALARLRAQLYGSDGVATGGLVNSGFVAVGVNGDFFFTYDYPDGFRGGVQFRDTDTGAAIPNFPVLAVNPEEIYPSPVGSNLVTINVNDDNGNPLTGVNVRLIAGAYSYYATTSGGVVSFGLDDGDYTLVMNKPGYEFTPTTETISGDTTVTRIMIASAVTPSSDPQTTNAFLYVYDRTGALSPNTDITFKLLAGPGEVGQSHYSKQFSKASNSAGLLTITLLRNSQYQAWRGDDEDAVRVIFNTDENGTYLLPEILGWE